MIDQEPIPCSAPSPIDYLGKSRYDEELIFARLRELSSSQQQKYSRDNEKRRIARKKKHRSKRRERVDVESSHALTRIEDSIKRNQQEIIKLKGNHPQQLEQIQRKIDEYSQSHIGIQSRFSDLTTDMKGIQKNIIKIQQDLVYLKSRQDEQKKNRPNFGREKWETIKVKPRHILESEKQMGRASQRRAVVVQNHQPGLFSSFDPQETDKVNSANQIKAPNHILKEDGYKEQLRALGASPEAVDQFFRENNIQDTGTREFLTLKIIKFLKKYSKSVKKYQKVENSNNGINKNKSVRISEKILDSALKNCLEEHEYRGWLESADQNQIKANTLQKSKVLHNELGKLGTSQRVIFGRAFDNNQLLFFLDLKKLFFNDIQFYNFLKENYPAELILYKSHLFPSIKPKTEPRVNTHANHDRQGYSGVTRINRVTRSTPKVYRTQASSSRPPEKSRNRAVNVGSEYLGKSNFEKSYYQSSFVPKVTKKVNATYSEPLKKSDCICGKSQIVKNTRKNNYDLQPKVIRRSYNYPRKHETVQKIIEQKGSQNPRRVLSVSRFAPSESKKVYTSSYYTRNGGFDEYKIT